MVRGDTGIVVLVIPAHVLREGEGRRGERGGEGGVEEGGEKEGGGIRTRVGISERGV